MENFFNLRIGVLFLKVASRQHTSQKVYKAISLKVEKVI